MSDRVSAMPPVAFLDGEQASLEDPVPVRPSTQRRNSKTVRHGLGTVWEGVRGKLGLGSKKTEPESVQDATARRQPEPPTREEILANYHDLVASGFFAAHARHGNRHGKTPPTAPQWPLAAPAAAPADVTSPVSVASSRGTKRGANDEHDDEPTTSHRFIPKRLRRAASRDVGLLRLPKKDEARRPAGGRRSVSASAGAAPSILQTIEEPNKLFKRPGTSQGVRASLDDWRKLRKATSARSLRPKVKAMAKVAVDEAVAEVVVPDESKGIPSVPEIPEKFTYGTDRENDGPWRGLRVKPLAVR